MKDNKVFCYNFIMHNITAQKQKEEMLYIDELTNTYNRKYFNDVFPRMISNIKRNGGCVNFIILDVDDFKKYNELYGIEQADKALVKISTQLKESLRRPDDYCFRLGGGEFALLYRSKSEDEGYLYAQVLKKNIEMLKIKHEGNVKYKVLTVSLGLVSQEKDRIDTDKKIYTLTYEHLKRAKEDGRNKVVRTLI
jgi:diguanylate cyclase (GGDEF)-like protein